MFEIPTPETLAQLSASAVSELRTLAENEITEIRASSTRETITEDQANRITELFEFVEQADTAITASLNRAASFDREIPAAPKAEVVAANVPAEQPKFDASGTKDVSTQTTAPQVTGGETAVITEAVVTAAGVQAVGIADMAPHTPVPSAEAEGGSDADKRYTILAAAPMALSNGTAVAHNQELSFLELAQAFQEASDGNSAKARTAGGRGGREHTRIASIRREVPAERTLKTTDTPMQAFQKLNDLGNAYQKALGTGELNEIEAANGFCTPSIPLFDTCSPITASGLWSGPRMVASRGGFIHNQGLDFADFFGGDFVLPIPGYNILTEAQVIADTAKTCFEIPCPPFVDDRLNIAALCLTGSILQNRTYPEFVSTFVEGSLAAMAHLVNREIINAIVTGSTAVALATVDPWVTDGTVLSQLLSAVEMAVVDLRYAYRTSETQPFTVVLPLWIKAQLRADYIRRNAAANNDIADSEIDAMFRNRGAIVQYVYDWQDAFNPGAIPAANQPGNATPILALPFNVSFLVYLPGTWVLAELDIIRLDMVYDSTLLAQNQVTQLFMEDGFKPMRMCSFSRVYSVNICPSGSTGAQRAVACADITP
jgi:hypothetical protein